MNFDRIKDRFPNGDVRIKPPFYMLDAINDIPGCLEACLDSSLLFSMNKYLQNLEPKQIHIVGCGTSFNACQAIAYLCRTFINIQAKAYDAFDFEQDLPSELIPDSFVIGISHSGHTMVTCLALERAKSLGAFTIGISGDPNSRLAKSVDFALTDPYHHEIPFGKTRSYLSSILLGMLAVVTCSPHKKQNEFLLHAKRMVAQIRLFQNDWDTTGKLIAADWAESITCYLLAGFGIQKANADEISLKIMEVLGEVANGFGLEEFMHGPYASFRKEMGIILFQTDIRSLEKALAVAKGITKSESSLLVITDQGESDWPDRASIINLPKLEGIQQLGLFPAAMAAQYFLYLLAVQKGINPDINGFEFHPELRDVVDIFFPPGTH